MMKPAAPVPISSTETSVELRWQGVEGATGWAVEARDPLQAWDEATRMEFNGGATAATIAPLAPACTFEFRLLARLEDGSWSEPSDAATYDTRVPNCGPKCAIM